MIHPFGVATNIRTRWARVEKADPRLRRGPAQLAQTYVGGPNDA